VRRYVAEEPLAPGSVVALAGRYWLVESVDDGRAQARPARYRLTLRHPDGREEAGAIRRFREDAPGMGHQLSTYVDGAPVTWSVVEQRLARDDAGAPFLESVAERDYAEGEALPDHQLEHALEREPEGSETAAAVFARAAEPGIAMELVALEAGQAPDWDEAVRFLASLTLDEIGEDLLELCGVHPGRDPQATWLDAVKRRLGDDLESFRADVEGNHDEIEEWDFQDDRIFAAVGGADDESNPLSGYGWMCRLVDSDLLGAAGFRRVRKALLMP
jgi:hypothetical protein